MAVVGSVMLCACSPAHQFKQVALGINMFCPQQMDESTVMDSVAYHKETNTFYYYYSVSGITKSNASFYQKNDKVIRQALQAELDKIDMKDFWDFGVTIKFIFSSSYTQVQLAEFTFTGPAN